jgi:hypothetical protein
MMDQIQDNQETNGPPEAFGWVDLPEDVEVVAQAQPIPSFGDTEAGLGGDIPDEALGWRWWKTATGTDFPELAQGSVGSCCAFGASHAAMVSMAGEVVSGDPESAVIPSPEVIYGFSRVQVNGGRSPFRSDGSTGAWVAQAMKDFGILEKTVVGSFDLSKYSEARCREFGSKGVPAELVEAAKAHRFTSISRIRTFEDFCRAIANGFGVIVASQVGFNNSRRDSEGFCKPSGRWAHCMAGLAYRKGKRPGGFIKNSWGANSNSGPKYPADDMPNGGFWVDAEVLERQMLSAGDSWAVSNMPQGFPLRRLSW